LKVTDNAKQMLRNGLSQKHSDDLYNSVISDDLERLLF